MVLNFGLNEGLQILLSGMPDPADYHEPTWECWSKGLAEPGVEMIFHLLEVKDSYQACKDYYLL